MTAGDRDDVHPHQPGLLLLPFGVYDEDDLTKPCTGGSSRTVGTWSSAGSTGWTPPAGRFCSSTAPCSATTTWSSRAGRHRDRTLGTDQGQWRTNIFDPHTLEGSLALRDRLRTWAGGRLVVQIVEMPIRCPVAPLEFTFLADAFFEEHGMRDKVDITYVTRLEGAFTKPIASRHINLEGDFVVGRVDVDARTLALVDGREVA